MNEKEIFLNIEEHLISDDKPSIYLENALKNHNLDNYPFSMISDLRDVDQNPKFHPEGNVFVHTMMVIDQGAVNRERSRDKRVFMWALLLHDIGKKPTTKLRKGRLTSYNHDSVGAEMAREFLTYFNMEENFIDEVRGLVRWHMQSLFVTKDMKFQNIGDMLRDVDINEIFLVSLSDRLGRGNLDHIEINKTKEEVRKFKEKITDFKRKNK
ncbi:HDIG domain-containing metalloprotein [Clostridium beijerinckii]|uniref:Nucleotidyltransferase with HDIG domain n=1 Tax=Clostridium beijerinckii TaxID=1520 RepID=A0A9Q5CR57_CLOBE|nr:HDIG domain-containing metalloprotein [Clostridium beijerinckii]AQS07888.1 multifunctional CCA protein [Clostridium beijerinckii]MBA2887209.1 putative nucleotidyltransferase with HDIG domain [Clostridium beijerinckii]MBA2902191.1 putative nucleotidyltransferase with HDIG domain [Clostridium beijerinckii]MBA2911922.1 putative nucleotidyltransferase with HDIG domain [Clostridium beijerinckii]MBA9017891.1 putative nucleotidyltransferase with HDIG domain [Clostridium beijerinckii]